MTSYELSGKVAIVTGSSAGLGEAIAVHFAKCGASVTLCGRNQERLEAARQKCVEVSGGKSNQFLTVQGDLCESEIRNRVVDETVAKFGQLDIVVANAGATNDQGSLQKITEEMFDTIIDINLKSVVFLLQRAAPHLVKAKGSVVTVSSIASTLISPRAIPYTIAKAALDHFTRTLSVVLGAHGVRVNTIRPGVFRTLVARDYKTNVESFVSQAKGIIPLKRLGKAQEVALAVGFLVSDASKYINGAQIDLDGGMQHVHPGVLGVLHSNL